MIKQRILGLKFLGVAALVLSNPWAYAQENLPVLAEFQFWTRIPKAELSCADEASELAKRLAYATHVDIVSSRCEGTDQLNADGQVYDFYSLTVNYRAQTALTPYTAQFVGDFYAFNPDQGYYTTFAECFADLSQQSATFSAATSLLAVTADCEPDLGGLGARYLLSVSGFGTPTRQLQILPLETSGHIDAAFRAAAVAMIEGVGGMIARISGGSVFYYAPEYRPVGHTVMARFSALTQCDSQLEDVRKMWKNAASGDSSVVVACLPALVGSTDDFSMEVIYPSERLLTGDFGDEAPHYFSFYSCMQDKARVLKAISLRNPSILGGVCHPDELEPAQFVLEAYGLM